MFVVRPPYIFTCLCLYRIDTSFLSYPLCRIVSGSNISAIKIYSYRKLRGILDNILMIAKRQCCAILTAIESTFGETYPLMFY